MPLPCWLTSAPIAHRGCYNDDERPENSLPAFRRAVELGAPFEFDVQLTSDDEPIVVHDRDFARVAGTRGEPVAELDLAAVRTLRIGSAGLPVPTLDDVLSLVDGAVPLLLDLRRWKAGNAKLEHAVADRLRGYRGDAAVQSFDPIAVRRLRGLTPQVPVGQASGSLQSAGKFVGALGRMMLSNAITRPDFINYELAALPSRPVSFWRNRGIPVIAYTAHSPEEELLARKLADNFLFSGYLPERYRTST
ncbi:glycerophosphodiester phosphodiesterase family protein [Saccharomonospora sp. NPDC006951]